MNDSLLSRYDIVTDDDMESLWIYIVIYIRAVVDRILETNFIPLPRSSSYRDVLRNFGKYLP